MNAALLIVDVQNDFCAGGALAVPEADAIVPTVNALVRASRRVFLSQDWHPRGHVSFASSHPGMEPFERIMLPTGEQIVWPDHCIAGTHGAAFHPSLEVPADATIVRKGTDSHRDAYSAFHGRDRATSAGLDSLLRRAAVGEILLCGLATDYCVLHTAIDARSLGYAVTVVESACRGIDVDGSLAAAWSRMTAAGVRRTWTAPSHPGT
jgi:nicotinamidase/pyrazinamidase